MTIAPVLTRSRVWWREILIGILLLVILIGSVATYQYTKKKGVSDKNQKTIDSLAVTKPAFDATQLQSRRTEAAHVAAGEVQRTTVARITVGADRARVTADELARAAITAVTDAQKWHAAYDARSREADSLRLALAAANARAESEQSARREADRRASLDSSRYVALQQLALGLEQDANKAANCRVLYIVPCATRTQVAIVSATAAAVVMYAVMAKQP